jgi:hypothetical protein
MNEASASSPSQPPSSIEAVGSFARRRGGEVDDVGPVLVGELQRGLRELLADPASSGSLIDDHILDPCAHTGRDPVRRQRERSQNDAIETSREK